MVNQDRNVSDILVTSLRDAKAAARFFRKLLRSLRAVLRVPVTDKLASYGVGHCGMSPHFQTHRHRLSAEQCRVAGWPVLSIRQHRLCHRGYR